MTIDIVSPLAVNIFMSQGEPAAVNNEIVFIKNEETLAVFLQQIFEESFNSFGRIAVKTHMGEPGNIYYIKPELARLVCGILSGIGCEPFIFDTPVNYSSQRNSVDGYLRSAAANGYSERSLGFPVVVSDLGTEVKGTIMTYELAEIPLKADGVVLLSHVKGHIACGMGGAIKNAGMGCMTKKTKGAIHSGGEPVYERGCVQCGECVEGCPTKNIRMDSERPHFDCTWCCGCSNCAIVCPEECIIPRTALFDDMLAEAAVVVQERFEKVYAVNVLENISKLCDCMAASGPIIVPDIGFICGEDMLSVDVASLEMIEKVSGKGDIFAEYNIRSPWGHIRAAARFMGREPGATVKEIVQE
jgi:uncharacterized Fe-S center protein